MCVKTPNVEVRSLPWILPCTRLLSVNHLLGINTITVQNLSYYCRTTVGDYLIRPILDPPLPFLLARFHFLHVPNIFYLLHWNNYSVYHLASWRAVRSSLCLLGAKMDHKQFNPLKLEFSPCSISFTVTVSPSRIRCRKQYLLDQLLLFDFHRALGPF